MKNFTLRLITIALISLGALSAAKKRRIIGEIIHVPRLVFVEKESSTVLVRSDVSWKVENICIEVSEQGMINITFEANLSRGLLSTRAQISFKDENGKIIDNVVTPYETLYSKGKQSIAHSVHSENLQKSFSQIAYIEVMFI